MCDKSFPFGGPLARLIQSWRDSRFLLLPIAAMALVSVCTPAEASLAITPTFSSTLTVAEQTAINSAILTVEADITSSSNLNVAIYFTAMSSGLGESITTIYGPTYLDFYNKLSAVATSANQHTALTSLGTAPTTASSTNPANGTTTVDITSAEARNIGFSSDTGFVTVNGVSGTFDG
jgi:hypothetical protein